MITSHPSKNILKNNRGFLAADFIFALIISIGVSIVLFAMTFTFSMAEVSQYIVFSASRAHAAGHLDPESQNKMGQDKFKELLKNSELSNMLSSKASPWFYLSNLDIRGGGKNGKTFNDDYSGYEDRIPFVGARADFEAKLLNLRIPLLGSTENPDGDGYKAKITAFLIREPTQKECMEQIKERYKAILNLDSRYQGSGTTSASSRVNQYFAMEDNGC